MRTITIPIYSFGELSDKAKEYAKDRHASTYGYESADEAIASLEALAEAFDGKMRNCEIDFFGVSPSSATFDMPQNMKRKDISAKLKTLGSYDKKTLLGHGDCLLTGWCFDENAIDGFRQAFRKGVTKLNDLMQAAFITWLKDAQEDCEQNFSDESFQETCDSNQWMFYANGQRYFPNAASFPQTPPPTLPEHRLAA